MDVAVEMMLASLRFGSACDRTNDSVMELGKEFGTRKPVHW